MGKVNSFLNERLKKADHGSKMAALAQQSAKGNLTTFSGIFKIVELNEAEKDKIKMEAKNSVQYYSYENIGNRIKDLLSV